MQRTTIDINPILSIENDNLLATKKGLYSKIFSLKLKPIFSLDEKDYENMNDEFSRFFHYIPDYTIIHKLDVFTKEKYKTKKFGYKTDILTSAYELKFNEHPYLNHESYLIFSKTTKKLFNQNSGQTGIFNKHLVDPKLLEQNTKDDFTAALRQIVSICKESKYFDLEVLPFEKLTILFKSYLNLDFKSKKEYTSDILHQNGELKIGNKHVVILAVNQIECFDKTINSTMQSTAYSTDNSKVYFSSLYPIGLGLKENHLVNQIFIKGEKNSIREILEKDLKNSNIFISEKDKQQEMEGFVYSRKTDLAQFIDEIDNDHLPIKMHTNVILWHEDKSELTNIIDKSITAFNKIKIKANIVINETMALYSACFPGNVGDLGIKDQTSLFLDQQAAAFNIFETVTTDCKGDFGIRLSDRLSGNPLYVDISDAPIKRGLTNNRNKIIFGPSGSGKSFFTNHAIHNYLKHGVHCVIIDVGHSYDRLCLKEKGLLYEYSKEKPLTFNPFFLTKEGLSLEKKESLLNLLFTLWKENSGDQSKPEYALLSKALDDYYKEIGINKIFACFDSLYEFLQNDFVKSLVKEGKEDLFNYNSFLTVLAMFYKGGEYDYLLNATENLDVINKQFIVFELDNIKDHKILYPVVTLLIMDTFISKMRHPDLENTRKLILVEEAWAAIANEGMASFMQYLYKTVRKHFGEAWLVTQEIEDILDNKIVKNAIIKNCGAKILLDMREYSKDIDRIQKLLSLDNKAKEMILSLNLNNIPGSKYKELFIALGNEGNVYGVNLSHAEYATYTTEKTEKNIIMDYYKEYNDIEMAINQYAEDLKNKM